MRKITPKEPEHLTPMNSRQKPEKMYPRIRIENEHLPEAKKWEIGSEYTVTLKLKMVGLSISKFQNEAEFEIHGIDPKGGKDHK